MPQYFAAIKLPSSSQAFNEPVVGLPKRSNSPRKHRPATSFRVLDPLICIKILQWEMGANGLGMLVRV